MEERFQSARDLAFQLQQLQESTAKGRPCRGRPGRTTAPGGPGPPGRGCLRGAGRRHRALPPAARAHLRAAHLPTRPRRRARFASGGQSVVYSVSGDDNEMEVWRLDLADSPRSQSLGYRRADVLATRKGELAPVRGAPLRRRRARGGTAGDRVHRGRRSSSRAHGGCGGRGLGRRGRAAGRGVLDGDGGEGASNTRSAARCTRRARSAARASPGTAGTSRSWRTAAARGSGARGDGGPGGALHGAHRRLSQRARPGLVGRRQRGLVHGRRLARRTAPCARSRWAAACATSSPRPPSLTLWDIASDGRVLLSHEEETRGVMGRPPGAAAERDLSYHDSSGLASLSPDGRWILMGDQFGLLPARHRRRVAPDRPRSRGNVPGTT